MEGKVINTATLPVAPGNRFQSIRTDEWYYVQRSGGEPNFLQHIPSDPLQAENLVDDPNVATEQAQLAHRVRVWVDRVTQSQDTGAP